MNVLPKISGHIEQHDGVCRLTLPLGYEGEVDFAALFPIERSQSPVLRFETDASIPAEGYRLTVSPGGVTVASSEQSGAFYAMHTLMQFSHGQRQFELPCGVFSDAPRMHYRSFMIDSGRHFFEVDEVKRMIEQCAQLKLNVLHWHLSEDQGFRIESKRFPKLNEISSWRTEADGSTYGGFYTQDEIRDVVSYAAERYMTVVPEIDLPGHTTAIVAAFPELSCSGEPCEVEHRWGIFPRILCAGRERVYEFLYALLDELLPLFPGKYFHIGGDEAPKDEWKKCPRCQQTIKENGLADEEALQAWFTDHLVKYLNDRGKTVIGWNEILASGTVGPNVVAQYWTLGGAEYTAREIPKGRRFVFSPVSSCYFDYDPSMVTLEGAYRYEPSIPGGEAIKQEQILGMEAPLWAEHIATPERLEYMAFPRIAALAENAWTSQKDYADFCRRLKIFESHWRAFGINAQPVEEAIAFDPSVTAKAVVRMLRGWRPDESEEEFKAKLLAAEPGLLAGITSPTFTDEQRAQIVAEIKKLAD